MDEMDKELVARIRSLEDEMEATLEKLAARGWFSTRDIEQDGLTCKGCANAEEGVACGTCFTKLLKPTNFEE